MYINIEPLLSNSSSDCEYSRLLFVYQQIQVPLNFPIDWFSYLDSNPEMQKHICARPLWYHWSPQTGYYRILPPVWLQVLWILALIAYAPDDYGKTHTWNFIGICDFLFPWPDDNIKIGPADVAEYGSAQFWDPMVFYPIQRGRRQVSQYQVVFNLNNSLNYHTSILIINGWQLDHWLMHLLQ